MDGYGMKSSQFLSLSFLFCKMGLTPPRGIHRQESRPGFVLQQQSQISQHLPHLPPPHPSLLCPWSSRYLPDASHPVTAMVTCSCLPSVRGRNVNSSMAPTRFFILYPEDPDTKMRVEMTGDPRNVRVALCAHTLTVSANCVPCPWTNVPFSKSLKVGAIIVPNHSQG